MTVYTIKTRLALAAFGYESTHSFRQRLLDEMGIDHELIILYPFTGLGYQQVVRELGLNPAKTTILPNLFSDLSPNEHTLSVDDFIQTLPSDYEELIRKYDTIVYQTPDKGYLDVLFNPYNHTVYRVIEKDRELRKIKDTYYTEGKYMSIEQDSVYQFFKKDGSEAIRIDTINDTVMNYWIKDIKGGRDELILSYLMGKLKKGDLILNDEIDAHSPLLERFAKERGACYLSVLHGAAHFVSPRNPMRRPRKLLTAHPLLSQHLLEQAHVTKITETGFLHPIAFDVAEGYPRALHQKRAYVAGNFSTNKGIPSLIKAFKQLPDWSLDIYGGNDQAIQELKEELQPTDNIQFKGFVPSAAIPRSDYAVILSASMTEVWANSVMEGMAEGCLPVLTNVLYQPKLVNDELGLAGFDSITDLLARLGEIAAMSDQEREAYSDKAKAYVRRHASLSAAKETMQALLDSIS